MSILGKRKRQGANIFGQTDEESENSFDIEDGIVRSTSGVLAGDSVNNEDITSLSFEKITSVPDFVTYTSNTLTNGFVKNTDGDLETTTTITNSDITSLEYSKITNKPSILKPSITPGDVTYCSCILRFTKSASSGYTTSLINPLGLTLNPTGFATSVRARIDITTPTTVIYAISVTCGRLPFVGVYLPRIESDITGAFVSNFDIRIYESYDGLSLTDLPSGAGDTYDFPIIVMQG